MSISIIYCILIQQQYEHTICFAGKMDLTANTSFTASCPKKLSIFVLMDCLFQLRKLILLVKYVFDEVLIKQWKEFCSLKHWKHKNQEVFPQFKAHLLFFLSPVSPKPHFLSPFRPSSATGTAQGKHDSCSRAAWWFPGHGSPWPFLRNQLLIQHPEKIILIAPSWCWKKAGSLFHCLDPLVSRRT